MRTALLWVVKQLVVVISYRRLFRNVGKKVTAQKRAVLKYENFLYIFLRLRGKYKKYGRGRLKKQLNI